jgi:hypothetical protein
MNMPDAIAALVSALQDAIPVLERAATEEARANLAPRGLKKSTIALERLERAKAALKNLQ